MDAQWCLLGIALGVTSMTVSAVVSPNGLVRGNLAWFAVGWLGSEFAPWLTALALFALACFAEFSDALGDGPGRLAAMLLAASAGGLVVVAARSRLAAGTLETALRAGLGRAYMKEIPAERLPALDDDVPLLECLRVWPWRSRG